MANHYYKTLSKKLDAEIYMQLDLNQNTCNIFQMFFKPFFFQNLNYPLCGLGYSNLNRKIELYVIRGISDSYYSARLNSVHSFNITAQTNINMSTFQNYLMKNNIKTKLVN